jgi:hypothetical protein
MSGGGFGTWARRGVVKAAPLLLLAAACSGGTGGSDPFASSSPGGTGPAPISYDPDRPWVVTAIDYHFHDAHPTPELNPFQPLVFRNEGRNLHNVTIAAAGYDLDIAPGEERTIDVLGELLPPGGTYRLVCTIHADRGMGGRIVVAEE